MNTPKAGMAAEAEVSAEEVAGAVVLSTILSFASLPLLLLYVL